MIPAKTVCSVHVSKTVLVSEGHDNHHQNQQESQMAQKIQTLLIDDIDGSLATETVQFSLDGTDYEIELNAQHSGELRRELARFIAHARKTSGTRPARNRSRASQGTTTDLDPATIRTWAAARGKQVNPRGRVPADIVAEYVRETES
jgi:nucleoid-associated protein Lsr2